MRAESAKSSLSAVNVTLFQRRCPFYFIVVAVLHFDIALTTKSDNKTGMLNSELIWKCVT